MNGNSLEKRILELAIKRGYLQLDLIKSIKSRLSESETITHQSEWGVHIDYLLREGYLNEALLEQLKREIIDDKGEGNTVLRPNTNPTYHSSLSGITSEELPFAKGEKYRLVKILGTGGMGRVYLAEDLHLNRKLALKFLHYGKESGLLRFMQEARSQARIQHPNVCSVYEVGEIDGRSYIAMEYIEGESLKDLQESLNLEQKVGIIQICAEALQAAHSLGIIHRDIKPSNIMVERRDDGSFRPVIMDFGLARESDSSEGLTESGALIGTPAYMSPEQARGNAKLLDRRTDIYSLGVVLYELVTGSQPFKGETLMSVVMSVIEDEPVFPRVLVPQLPRDLEAIILKCLEKDPSRRYDSAAALASDLQSFLDGKPVDAVQKTFRYKVEKFAVRHRSIIILSFIVFLVLISAGGFAIRSELHAKRQLQIAQQFAFEVNELDFLMQRAYLLPLHDIRPEREQVARKLTEIEIHLTELGNVAYSPGYYALARGHFILKHHQKALEYLEKAQAVGNLDPEIDYYRGLILIGIYQDRLVQAASVANKDERKAVVEALKREFIPKIEQSFSKYLSYLSELQQGREAEQSVEYVEGLLNLYRGNWDKALECNQLAIERYPWFYKARIVKAEILNQLQEQAFAKGEYEKAVEYYKKSMEALAEAETIGRSDPDVYRAQLNAIQKYFRLNKNRKHLEPEIYQAALAVYERAIKVDPQSIEARVAMSYVCNNFAEMVYKSGGDPSEYWNFALRILNEVVGSGDSKVLIAVGKVHLNVAEYKYYSGLDVREEFEKAATYFKKSLEADPGNGLVLGLFGYLYITKYDYEMKKGLELQDSFQNAIHYLKLSLEYRPNFSITYTNLGYIYEQEATRLLRAGLDPSAMFHLARESYRKSLELNPRSVVASNNLGILLVRIAEYEFSGGRSPDSYLKEAEEKILQGLSYTSEYPNSHNNLSYIYRMRAEMEWREGRSPQYYLDRAIESAKRAVTISPTYSSAWSNLGNAHILKVEYKLEQGQIERASVVEAREDLERAIKQTPDSSVSYQRLAKLELLLARQAILLKKSPEKHFQMSMGFLERALELNPKVTDNYLLGIEICFRWGMYLHSQKRSVDLQEERAGKMLAKARELTTENADLLTAQAEVEYLQSLRGSHKETFKKVQQLLERSTQLNRWRKKRNALLLAEMSR